ncbi:hook-length control protein FliK [Rhodoferax sp. OV413]|uniref:flagellar hook-length control protein FliK n=1 Tax=Rhodoferax sp. OV413 TaxID=1855285 RepID=UPI000881AE56|nr:flagellar hook-length control protein FliK [Rhodoferax sp. OV413]SDP93294.1 hook-length control protein FliK [Rhodoferax sp. OV413]
MSIESVPVALVPKASEIQQGGARAKADSANGDKEPDAFSNLLNGLDKEPEASPEKVGEASSDEDSEAKGLARKKSAGISKPAKDTVVPDATWLAPAVPVVAPVTTPQAGVSQPETSNLVGELEAAASGVADTGKGGPQLTAPDNRVQSANLANYASVFEQIQSRLAVGSTAAVEAGQPTAGLAEAGKKGSAKPVLGTAVADVRADRLASLAEGGMWVMPVTEPSATQLASDAATALKAAALETKDISAVKGEKSYEGGMGLHQFTPTVQFDSTAVAVDATQMAPEAAIADQVNYWISQGIQNAELTFDGAGAEPVQVSISLSGNEAHVEFRTDQVETRELLTGAASHLKDLLQQEGMVLSGLSVGSSGAGGAGARERRAPSEDRQNAARNVSDQVAVRAVVPARTSGRAVDLFV